MKQLLSGIALVSLLVLTSACAPASTSPETDGHVITESWGTVKHMTFIRHTKSAAYFKVQTDSVTFDSLDITSFPGERIDIGDKIFLQTTLTSGSASTSMCKNNTCLLRSVCYSWMPCFNKYEGMLEDKP